MDARQKRCSIGSPSDNSSVRGYGVRSSGLQRRGIRGNFVPPIRSNGSNIGHINSRISGGKGDDALDDATKKWLVGFSFMDSRCLFPPFIMGEEFHIVLLF